MSAVRTLYHLMRADFLERVRRYSFLITLGVVVYGAYLFLPPNHSVYATLQMGGHRGVYNSAWVGAVVGMMGAIFLALIGFYLVKNAIRRDRLTGVGEIIAGTPTRTVAYTVGKALSNFAVLGVMAAVLVVASAGMQLVRGESYQIDVWALASPTLFVTLPILATVAGAAVLFESIRFLRGGIGNAVWYGLWTTALATEMEAGSTLLGHNLLAQQMREACARSFPDYSLIDGSFSSGFHFKDNGALWDLTTFEWSGVTWTQDILMERLVLVAMGLVLAIVAAIFFDRFSTPGLVRQTSASSRGLGLGRLLPQRWRRLAPVYTGDGGGAVTGQLSTLDARERRGRFRLPGLVRAEWRLLIYRHGQWWWIVTLGLIAAGVLVPIEIARRFLWPAAMIWPLLLWSSMGTRGVDDRTGQLILSSPHPLLRQMPAAWLAGVIATALVSSGMGLRLLMTGDGYGLFAWIVGVLFVPTLAITLGVWTGTSKFFEIAYLMIWYGGPVSRAPFLDYMGMAEESVATGMPGVYLLITLGLLGIAWVGRWWRLRG